MAIIMSTGGNLPPDVVQNMQTGGNLPPNVQTMGTGGNTPPVQVSSGGLPTTSPIQMMDWEGKWREGNTSAMTRNVTNDELVKNQLNSLIASDSQYIRQAQDRARAEASSRGMMLSSMAAGAGQRAAIDAALPIASQDAATYGRTASENMAAVNNDRLADQGIWGNLTGQAMGIRANLDESERARGFTERENERLRAFQSSERMASQAWQSGERAATQSWQQQMQQMNNEWQAAQNSTQRQHELLTLERQQAHDAAQRVLDQSFQGSQLDKQLLQQRFLEFENSMQNQSNQLAQVIASIYNNPNLKPADQAAAVNNARTVFQSLYTSYAQSMSGGVPPIFYNPYPMGGSQPSMGTGTGGTLPPTGTTTPPLSGPTPPLQVGGTTGTTAPRTTTGTTTNYRQIYPVGGGGMRTAIYNAIR